MVAINKAARTSQQGDLVTVSREIVDTAQAIRSSWSMEELHTRRAEARRLQRLIFGQEVRVVSVQS